MDTHSQRGRRQRLRTVAPMLVMILIFSACSSSEDDPAAVLADYQDARNSGDVDAVMALYAEDAVVESHPLGADEAAGVSQIRILEARIPGIQGSTGGIEFTDLVVSGDTVTFKETFFNAGGSCFSAAGNEVTVEDGKITLFVWGEEEDPSLCG